MVRIVRENRKSAVLTPSSVFCLGNTPTVNLTAGCVHGCLYCYARGYSSYPGDGRLVLYGNTLELLRDELRRKRKKPRTVYFSTSTDLFQPVPEVLDLGYEVLEFLLKNRLGVSFLTKGVIPEKFLQLIAKHSGQVAAGIGIVSLSESISSVFEPGAAAPAERLENVRSLVRLGVDVAVRLDPILPGVTDNRDEISALLSAAASAGVKRVAVSALFMRPLIGANMKRCGSELAGRVLEQFERGAETQIHGGIARVLALPKPRRRRMYESIGAVCGKLGLEMKCCTCKNPDVVAAGSCSIAGQFAAKHRQKELQGKLF
ncbi:MAG: radical SAM protein [Planctomycetota bacterium]|nr:MAG: radical SAM protein [Planctomycetota bacterium]